MFLFNFSLKIILCICLFQFQISNINGLLENQNQEQNIPICSVKYSVYEQTNDQYYSEIVDIYIPSIYNKEKEVGILDHNNGLSLMIECRNPDKSYDSCIIDVNDFLKYTHKIKEKYYPNAYFITNTTSNDPTLNVTYYGDYINIYGNRNIGKYVKVSTGMFMDLSWFPTLLYDKYDYFFNKE
jgi:hypothetical protein